ncbi:sensor histidine kinase [Lysobacter silvisoli]|uniref:sensor histidine kinase n=1 Tax=Lysobacter silvisoli TaxID=2293254 RepID=UPI001314B682|nr:ATP-binding protein [Lysobacter silvisoli]
MRWWLPALLACAFAGVAYAAVEPGVTVLDRGEAVRSDWSAAAPPAAGWVPVQLLDLWHKRWPEHDGVVWYRLHWQQQDPQTPTALLADYMSLSGAIYVNGEAVARDPSLVEPLSRTWNSPHYALLPASLLRAGENTVWLRVSGLTAYQPGAGPVRVGDPQALQQRYRSERFQRYDIKLINLAMAVVLGGVFLLMWLLRRKDSVYGWFALTELAGSLYGYNHIATGIRPLPSTDAWQAFNAAFYVCAGASYALFLLRYCERSYPRLERVLAALCVLALLSAALLPAWTGPHRNLWFAVGGLCYYVAIGWFLVQAWRSRRPDALVLAACLLLPVLVSFRDFALFFGWIGGTTYWLSLTSLLTLIGIGFVLSYRFVAAMRRVEGFNLELKREVDAATTELAQTLARQHALELAHSRAGERLQLVRDLHDGFGGTLVGAIAQLEATPADASKAQLIATLKELRDDLRLVIDSTAREHADLSAQLAPLRHRLGRLLETADIDSRWQLQNLDGIELDSARSLDLLRLLQEALTNVYKHSRARRVDVALRRAGGHLQLSIDDDGHGIGAAAKADGGAGLASMRSRAQRLGGELRIESGESGTALRLEFPLAG